MKASKSQSAVKSQGPFQHVKYTRIATPKFASEKEEAEWWDTHDVSEFLRRAQKAGAATHGTVARALETKPTNIRLNVADVAAAKEIAARKGLKFQTYIKMVLHEAVERDKAS